ncbi:MAG: M28 family peptidase [Bacteroidales bacterium]|nr:M28 family peptidase [Bacteroidales bacterium]
MSNNSIGKRIIIVVFFIIALSFIPVSCSKQDSKGELEEEINVEPIKSIYQWFDYLCSPELGGRYSGSIGIGKAKEYICNVIGLSDSLEVRTFHTNKCEMSNILFHIEGVKDSIIVLGAHYDAYGYVNNTALPGADDNMSGVAVLMRLVKLLQANKLQPEYDLDICFYDGEEIGRYGSWNYLSTSSKEIKMYINVDTCGNRDCGLGFYYDPTNPQLKEEFVSILPLLIGIKSKVANYNPVGYTTDCEPFAERNVPYVSVMNSKSTGYNHTSYDIPSHISYRRINTISEVLYEYLKSL